LEKPEVEFIEILQLKSVSFVFFNHGLSNIDILNKYKWRGHIEIGWEATRVYLVSSIKQGKNVDPTYGERIKTWGEWNRWLYGYFTGHEGARLFGNSNDGGNNQAYLGSALISYKAENKNSLWTIDRMKNPLRFWTYQNFGGGGSVVNKNEIEFRRIVCKDVPK
jgi:hypothetical protein